MQNARHAIQAYKTASRYRSQREQEADVFHQAIVGLRRGQDGTAMQQIRALADNRRLWMMVIDLMRDPTNALPESLRVSMVSVGLSVMAGDGSGNS